MTLVACFIAFNCVTYEDTRPIKRLTNLAQGWPFTFRYFGHRYELDRYELNPVALIANVLVWVSSFLLINKYFPTLWRELDRFHGMISLLLLAFWGALNLLWFTPSAWTHSIGLRMAINVSVGACLFAAVIVYRRGLLKDSWLGPETNSSVARNSRTAEPSDSHEGPRGAFTNGNHNHGPR